LGPDYCAYKVDTLPGPDAGAGVFLRSPTHSDIVEYLGPTKIVRNVKQRYTRRYPETQMS
jgi:hypothetical protein